MSKVIVQINYSFASSRAEHTNLVTPAAEPIAAAEGLLWKIWLMNEAAREGGGIYLFTSREAVDAFMNHPVMAAFAANPAISNISVKIFEPDETLSRITRAPLSVGQAV
ncbi:MAG: YdhR family protein [Anaerolineae bacterium]|nr:YdhR family protein [Anaerolineae bacterium]